MPIPPGLDVTCPDQTHIVIKGIDKQKVGQFAAEVRAVRKPEPYKGKGIRYEGEQVRRKQGKAAQLKSVKPHAVVAARSRLRTQL